MTVSAFLASLKHPAALDYAMIAMNEEAIHARTVRELLIARRELADAARKLKRAATRKAKLPAQG